MEAIRAGYRTTTETIGKCNGEENWQGFEGGTYAWSTMESNQVPMSLKSALRR